ncbi:putative transposase [Kitasatospora sp. GP30]|nr:putative transposase [Kitasatospora sp. GP30]
MLLRLAYLTVTNAFAALRLLLMSDREKDVEVLALRHQLTVLERQLGGDKARFAPEDRVFLAALLAPLPREVLRRLRLLVRPDTVLRWHRDLMKQRHARTCQPKRPGRPPTVRSIRVLILRLVRENPAWGYRRVHGELAALGIKIAASTVWEILKAEGLDPAPDRSATTWADFLRSQADAILACDFIETVTLTGQRQYILAVIEHATLPQPSAGRCPHRPHPGRHRASHRSVGRSGRPKPRHGPQGRRRRCQLHDPRPGAKFPALFDQILGDAGIQVVLSGVRVPRMNSVMERWVQTCRHELLDRTLIWNERHLRYALSEFEHHRNGHRPHQAMNQAAPLRAVPEPITDPGRIARLDIRRHDRLGGVIHEHRHAA